MTKIITCAELRHPQAGGVSGSVPEPRNRAAAHGTGFVRAHHRARQPGKRQPRHGDMPGPAGAPASDALDGLVTLCRSRGSPPRGRYLICSAGLAATRRWIKERLRRLALLRIPRMISPVRSLRVFSECVPSSR